MRPLLLAFAASSLALAGCGKKQAETNSSALDATLSSDQQQTTNDTTSIDAATGSASNMAPDADLNLADNSGADDQAPPTDHKPVRPRTAAPVTANSSSNATAEPAPPVTPPANSTTG